MEVLLGLAVASVPLESDNRGALCLLATIRANIGVGRDQFRGRVLAVFADSGCEYFRSSWTAHMNDEVWFVEPGRNHADFYECRQCGSYWAVPVGAYPAVVAKGVVDRELERSE